MVPDFVAGVLQAGDELQAVESSSKPGPEEGRILHGGPAGYASQTGYGSIAGFSSPAGYGMATILPELCRWPMFGGCAGWPMFPHPELGYP